MTEHNLNKLRKKRGERTLRKCRLPHLCHRYIHPGTYFVTFSTLFPVPLPASTPGQYSYYVPDKYKKKSVSLQFSSMYPAPRYIFLRVWWDVSKSQHTVKTPISGRSFSHCHSCGSIKRWPDTRSTRFRLVYAKNVKPAPGLSGCCSLRDCTRIVTTHFDSSGHWQLGIVSTFRNIKPNIGCRCRQGYESWRSSAPGIHIITNARW